MALTSDFNASGNVAFSRMRMLLQESALQEGVYGANDLKVVQRGAGANMSVDVGSGAAWVQVDTGTRNGLAHCYNDATANVVVTASNGSNPRIDQIVLRFNDTTIPTGSGNVPTLECLAGTATVGATLDNRTGAAALPNDCLRLADILVPTSSTTVVTANIRDRRPWARGAYSRTLRSAGDYTTTSTSVALIDSTNLQPRIECSGVPLRVRMRATGRNNGAGNASDFDLFVDGASAGNSKVEHGSTGYPASMNFPVTIVWDYVPSPGSRLIGPAWAASAGTSLLTASGAFSLDFSVEEIIRQNANNT